MFNLAWPVTLTVLATMSMQVVDTLMVGRLGNAAIAALSLSCTLIFSLGVFPRHIVIGIEPLVSQAFGAKDDRGLARILRHAFLTSAMFAPLYVLGMVFSLELLLLMGQPSDVSHLASEYCWMYLWAVPFELAFFVLSKWLLGQKIVRVTTVVVGLANVLNVAGNYLFVFVLQFGLIGSAISTVCCVVFQLALLVYLTRRDWRMVFEGDRSFDVKHLKHQLRLGIPASFQISFECWGFAATVFVVGWMGEMAMAAHAIALNISTVLFMIPLGLSAAASTRVGNRIGEGRDWKIVAKIAFVGTIGVQVLSGLLLYLVSPFVVSLYTSTPETVELTTELCLLVALFQVFDGGQVVGFGVLRGMADMFVPAVLIIICHWMIGLPLGYWLAFPCGHSLFGIWVGLSIALGIAFSLAWRRIVHFGRADDVVGAQ